MQIDVVGAVIRRDPVFGACFCTAGRTWEHLGAELAGGHIARTEKGKDDLSFEKPLVGAGLAQDSQRRQVAWPTADTEMPFPVRRRARRPPAEGPRPRRAPESRQELHRPPRDPSSSQGAAPREPPCQMDSLFSLFFKTNSCSNP